MWQQPMWAAVVLIPGLVIIWLGNRRLRSYLEIQRQALAISEEEQHLALRERAVAVSLDEATEPQRAELKRAELLHQAAQERVAEHVTDDPQVVNAMTTGELAVIAARTERRVQAAIDGTDVEGDAAILEALLRGYAVYIGDNNAGSFGDWFGDADISGLSVKAVEQLVNAYCTYVEANNSGSFGDWFGDVNPQAFQ